MAGVASSLFVFDTGTTGTSPSQDHVTSFSFLLHEQSNALNRAQHSTEVRIPQHRSHPRIPRFHEAWPKALTFIRRHTVRRSTPFLLAHNAPFDAAFILAELNRADLPVPSDILVVDTLELARQVLPELQYSWTKKYSLEHLAEHFGINVVKQHVAKYDVRVLSNILTEFDNLLAEKRSSILRECYKTAVSLEEMALRYVDKHLSDNETTLDPPTGTYGLSDSDTDVSTNCRTEGRIHYIHPLENKSTSALKVKHDPLTNEATTYGKSTSRSQNVKDFIITNTGRLYHLDRTCVYLNKARQLHVVSDVPSHLSPCPKCWKGKNAVRNVSDSQGFERKEGSRSERRNRIDNNAAGTSSADIITTRSGKYYHGQENCVYLRRAKKLIRVNVISEELLPCPKCWVGEKPINEIEDRSPHSPRIARLPSSRIVSRSDSFQTVPSHHSTSSATVSRKHDRLTKKQHIKSESDRASSKHGETWAPSKEESLQPFNSQFYRTRYGKKFHVSASCRYLVGREVLRSFPLAENRDPCRGCALSLYQEWSINGWISDK